jgi:hypothetical protein
MTNARPGSAPFVSGDTFRQVADHVFEQGAAFDPDTLHAGAVVFVESSQLTAFVSNCLPGIREPFVLITHNGDLNVDRSFLGLAEDNRIIRWFAQNCILRHPKVTAIPIGLENRCHHENGVIRDYQKLQYRSSQKTMRVLYGFTVGTNELERIPALKALRSSSIADSIERTNSRDYRMRLERYGFVASPPGHGIDCHRTWEALYLRTIPIVKRSMLYDSFPNLPVVALDDWSDVCGWDASFLQEMYARLSMVIRTTPFLDFNYWADMIQRSRAEIS